MKPKYCYINVLSLLFLSIRIVYSQWSLTPVNNLQVSPWGIQPIMCSDGKGGAFIAWSNFSYEKTRCYIQHITKDGFKSLAMPKIVADTTDRQDYYTNMIHDGNGGVIIALNARTVRDTVENYIFYTGKIILQRVDNNAMLLWGNNGVRASIDTNDHDSFEAPLVITNGKHGSIVLWRSKNSIAGSLYYNLTIQNISLNGQRMWGEKGIRVLDTLGNSFRGIVEDGSGGAIIQYSTNNEVFFQKFDSCGMIKWKTKSLHSYQNIISDKRGGAFVNGRRYSNGIYSLVVNRIYSNGQFDWGNEKTISDSVSATTIISENIVRSDSALIIYWTSNKNSTNTSQSYIQIVTHDGKIVFAGNGIQTESLTAAERRSTGCVLSENNALIALFIDNRNGDFSNYAQKIDSNGNLLWEIGGKLFSNYKVNDELIGYAQVISDGNGGIIAVSSIEPAWGIYVQQINRNGELGSIITSNYIESTKIQNYQFQLFQNFPNPFNPVTTLRYSIPRSGIVTLKVYDILGKEVATLVNGYKETGRYSVEFDASEISSGMYIYKLTSDKFSEVKKMMLVK